MNRRGFVMGLGGILAAAAAPAIVRADSLMRIVPVEATVIVREYLVWPDKNDPFGVLVKPEYRVSEREFRRSFPIMRGVPYRSGDEIRRVYVGDGEVREYGFGRIERHEGGTWIAT